MIQSRRKQIYSIDAKLYLSEEQHYPSLLNELEDILEEEIASFEAMPDGPKQSDRGAESKEAQVCLQRAIKALGKVVGGKKKTQELLDEVHENLRMV